MARPESSRPRSSMVVRLPSRVAIHIRVSLHETLNLCVAALSCMCSCPPTISPCGSIKYIKIKIKMNGRNWLPERSDGAFSLLLTAWLTSLSNMPCRCSKRVQLFECLFSIFLAIYPGACFEKQSAHPIRPLPLHPCTTHFYATIKPGRQTCFERDTRCCCKLLCGLCQGRGNVQRCETTVKHIISNVE